MKDITLDKPSLKSPFPLNFSNLILKHVSSLEKLRDQNKDKHDRNYLRKELANALEHEQYGRAISLLKELKDYNQGINWYILPANDISKHEMLIRDARNCEEIIKNAKEPYLIMALNYLRAAKALLGVHYEKIRGYLKIVVGNFYRRAINVDDDILPLFKQFNAVLVNNIAYILEISFEDALDRLRLAKDFTNLENTSRDIVTLTTLKDIENNQVIAFQADHPLTTLTAKLKEEYINRKQKKWFLDLPSWKQALVNQYVATILQENHILPTQLRSVPLPGLRNCWVAVDGIIKNNEVNITNHTFHSGAIVALGKNQAENVRLSLLNGEQLCEFTQTKKILLLTLNSDINPTGNDNTIVETTGLVAKKFNFHHANLPMNIARIVSANIYVGLQDILSIIAQFILERLKKHIYGLDADTHKVDPIFEKMAQYLSSKELNLIGEETEYQKFLNYLDTLRKDAKPNKDNDIKLNDFLNLCEILELGLHICYLIHNNKSVLDVDNRNLTLGCYTIILICRLNGYFEIAVNASCESGKDRAGILMFRTCLISHTRFLFGTYQLTTTNPDHQRIIQSNSSRLAAGDHEQFKAGGEGGTDGAFGIKKDSKSALPKTEFHKEVSERLIQNTASYNKKIALPDDPHKIIFFPLGDVDFRVQRAALIHVLSMHEKKENNLLNGEQTLTNMERFASFFKSKNILRKRTSKLTDLITKLDEVRSLSEIAEIISEAAVQHKELTKGTTYSVGETYNLLSEIKNHLEVLIAYTNRKIQQSSPSP